MRVGTQNEWVHNYTVARPNSFVPIPGIFNSFTLSLSVQELANHCRSDFRDTRAETQSDIALPTL